jgi:sialate O-acetylesterase
VQLNRLTVQLNRFHSAETAAEMELGWSTVREAQRQAARQLPGVAVVPTFDLTLTDTIHISSEGNLVLGERLAAAALGMDGQALSYLAPDAESARLLKGNRSIEISFANVISRIGCNDPTANCFRVEEGSGEVAIEKVEYPGNQTVTLRLGRVATAPLTVHGAWGANPATAPMDMERQIPILGFTLHEPGA